jgi:hypothetical protein
MLTTGTKLVPGVSYVFFDPSLLPKPEQASNQVIDTL